MHTKTLFDRIHVEIMVSGQATLAGSCPRIRIYTSKSRTDKLLICILDKRLPVVSALHHELRARLSLPLCANVWPHKYMR